MDGGLLQACKCQVQQSYFNMQAALDLFEADWDELIGKASTISADSEDQVMCLQTFLVWKDSSLRRRVMFLSSALQESAGQHAAPMHQ